jgi:formate dehydrogenase alpha subunit
MTNSIDDIVEQANAFFIIGSNTTEQHPVMGIQIRQAVKRRGAKVILADPRRIDLADIAEIHLRQRPGTDIALINGLMHVILAEDLWDRAFVDTRTENIEELRAVVERYTPEAVAQITRVPAEDLRRAARLLATTKPATLLYAMGITQHVSGHQNVLSCANLQMLLGNMGQPGGGVNPLRGQNNVQGACDMGGLPNVYPGYQAVTDGANRQKFEEAWGVALSPEIGTTVVHMLNKAATGDIRAMYVIGENPAMSDPDSNHVREALQNLDFLVVQDIFLTETARMADVVLPAASFAEKDGTFTNTERRVQRVRRAIPPVGNSRADWEIISDIARRMQSRAVAEPPSGEFAGWNYEHPSEIMGEIAALTPIYGGIDYPRIDAAGLQWPCPTADHPGTKILHVGRFSRGLGHFSGVEWMPPAEEPDAQYPLVLTTGRVLEHFHTGTMTRRVRGLTELEPEERLRIHPTDAQRVGLEDDGWATVTSRRGEVRVRAELTEQVQPGVVFLTFHFAEALGNVLTNPALDPVSKIPELKVCAVRVEATDGGEATNGGEAADDGESA